MIPPMECPINAGDKSVACLTPYRIAIEGREIPTTTTPNARPTKEKMYTINQVHSVFPKNEDISNISNI